MRIFEDISGIEVYVLAASVAGALILSISLSLTTVWLRGMGAMLPREFGLIVWLISLAHGLLTWPIIFYCTG